MSWVWALLLLCACEGLGVDLAQGGGSCGSNLLIGGSEVLQEERNRWACAGAGKEERANSSEQNLFVCSGGISAQSWDYVCGGVWRGVRIDRHQLSEREDRRVGDLNIGIPDVCEQSRFGWQCVRVQAPKRYSDTQSVASGVGRRVGGDVHQDRQCVFADAAQSLKCGFLNDCVRAFSEQNQSWDCRFSPLAESCKPCNGCLRARQFEVHSIAVETTEQAREVGFERGGWRLNPFEQEWQRISADLLHRVRSFVLKNAGVPLVEPFAQRPAVVCGLALVASYERDRSDGDTRKQKQEKTGPALHDGSMASRVWRVNHNCYALRN